MGHHVVTEVVADSLEQMGWSTGVLRLHVDARSPQREDRGLGVPTASPPPRPSTTASTSRTSAPAAGWRSWWTGGPPTGWSRPWPSTSPRSRPICLSPPSPPGPRPSPNWPRHGGVAGPPATVALCTDVCMHSLWVRDGINLFLVTSEAAAASVRRYVPRAPIAIVPAPVRPEFHRAPTQAEARAALGIEA